MMFAIRMISESAYIAEELQAYFRIQSKIQTWDHLSASMEKQATPRAFKSIITQQFIALMGNDIVIDHVEQRAQAPALLPDMYSLCI